MTTFSSVVEEILVKRLHEEEDRVAVVEASLDPNGELSVREWTLKRLAQRVCQLVSLLEQRDVQRGDRVAFVGDNSANHLAMFLACACRGWTAVPIDCQAPDWGVVEILQDAQPRVLCFFDENKDSEKIKSISEKTLEQEIQILTKADMPDERVEGSINITVQQLVATANEDLDSAWAIMYTSGTTSGKRKGAVRTQRGSILGFFNHLTHMHFNEQDVFLAIYPLHGISTFFFGMMMLYLGAQVVVAPRKQSYDGNFLVDALETFKVTYTTAGPSQFLSIINSALHKNKAFEPKHLRQVLVSGAMTSQATQEKIKSFFHHSRFFEVYGSTECGLITIISEEGFFESPGSVGKEPPGVPPLRFIDPVTRERVQGTKENPGEILAKTPMLFHSYWNRPGLNASCIVEDGYFRTGDMGYKDERGFLFLVGRADDRINLASGHSFYPAEVERIILTHPSVFFCVVFLSVKTTASQGGVEDQEAITCCVLRNQQSSSQLTQDQIEQSIGALCRSRLPPAQVPTQFWFISSQDQLPRTATGKVQRNQLHAAFLAKQP